MIIEKKKVYRRPSSKRGTMSCRKKEIFVLAFLFTASVVFDVVARGVDAGGNDENVRLKGSGLDNRYFAC